MTLTLPPLEVIAEEMRAARPPIVPFHWEVEFPEVFSRTSPGFDAIVGNPPFAGKNTLSEEEAAAFEAAENTRLNRDLFDPIKGQPSAGPCRW